eukprot:scaffold50690_cov17-Tisochrysis_lutea.AAC.2
MPWSMWTYCTSLNAHSGPVMSKLCAYDGPAALDGTWTHARGGPLINLLRNVLVFRELSGYVMIAAVRSPPM